MMRVSANFDSGNIIVNAAHSPDNIQLEIRKDHQSDFYQWFHFKLESKPFINHTISINNLAESAYPDGWDGYQAVASYDRESWFRVDTSFDGESLVIDHTPEEGSTYFAYFAPYSYERHLDLLAWAQTHDLCSEMFLGNTLDGRDMSMLTIGEPGPEKRNIWMIARQHPGESMAEWFVEGFLSRLLDNRDGVARQLLDDAVFYVVPNMNPDGSVRGHLRTNAAGINLNREWQSPSMDKSPEVALVLAQMEEIGVDLFLDIHGDEALPFNFVAGCEGNPSYSPRIAQLESIFKNAWLAATPEFQDDEGYDKDAPGEANMTVACNAVGEKFDCLSYTVEMPFKDNALLPDPVVGWSPERSQQLGQDIMIAIRAVVSTLREDTNSDEK